jgi:sugar O-acyltransferase (sialic acid O-acetyltransferase NeuD family)
MQVAIGSIFRDADLYLERYFNQVRSLDELLTARGDHLRLILLEGDSTDQTPQRLAELSVGLDIELLTLNQGTTYHGSVENDERFKQLAELGNTLRSHVREEDTAYIRLESDLRWDSLTLISLIGNLKDVPCCAPLVMHENGCHYDTWGFRRDSVRFTNDPPYHACLSEEGPLIQLDSAGSCVAMRAEYARTVRVPEDAFVGFCRNLYEAGATIWLDKRLKVIHPFSPRYRHMIVLGTSGSARVMAMLIQATGRRIDGFVGYGEVGEQVGPSQIVGDDDWLLNEHFPADLVIGIGHPYIREQVARKFQDNPRFSFPTLFHRTAVCEPWARNSVGQGTTLSAGVMMTCDVHIGNWTQVNLSATLGHDVTIGDYCVINPGANLSGNVTLGNAVLVGTGAQVLEGVVVGNNVKIGAGAVVVRDVPDGATVVGVPAKVA